MDISNKEEKGFKRICLPMCDRRVPCDISNEFTMPDYKPEIRRVLHVCPVVSVPAKYISSSSAEFSGNIDYNVLYVGADGELHSMPFSSEYSFETPIEAEGFDFNDEIASCCDTAVESLAVRLLGPRKINVKCRINSQVRIFGRKLIDQNFDFENSCDHIETLEEKVNNARIIRVDSDAIEMSDETVTTSENSGVISANADVHVLSIRPIDSCATLNGEIILKLLCVDIDDTSKTNVISKKIPFVTDVDADGVTSDSICAAKGYISDLAVTVEDERIICDMSLCLQLEAQNNEEINVVRDVYSTKYETNCTVKSYNLPSIGFAENGNFSMNEKISRESLGLPESFEIIDVYGTVTAEGCEIRDSKAELRGTAKYTLIVKAGDEYSSQPITLPVKYVFDCDDNNITSYINEINVISCAVRCDGDTVSLDAELGVVSVGLSSNVVTVVDDVKFSDEIIKSKGEITVVYPSADDDLWSVAKRYHVPVCEIEEKNPTISAYIIV